MKVREPSALENNLLFEHFFESFFGKDYYKGANKRQKYRGTLEINLSPVCNLGCKYCYMHKHQDGLFPEEIRDRNQTLNNLRMLLNWLSENEYNPNLDLFSGDPLTIELGLEALEIIVDHYRGMPPDLRPAHLSIPTNFSFILEDELVSRIEVLMQDFGQIGIKMLLSASLDGKVLENLTRPFTLVKDIEKSSRQKHVQLLEETSLDVFESPRDSAAARDDAFYTKVFEFAEKHKMNTGFHPMIYSLGIEKWKDNFLWYQAMFKKYDIPWFSLYLLEVRNPEWTGKQVAHLYDFMKFLIHWQHEEIYRGNTAEFADNIFTKNGILNISRSPFEIPSRGIGCSFQTTLYVRMGDLAIIPCHRTSYNHLNYGKFKVHNERIVGFESAGIENMIHGLVFNNLNSPICQSCLVKYSCHGGCLGAQLEETGDMHMPIPSVCRLEHGKILGILTGLEEIGALPMVYRKLNHKTMIYAFEKLLKMGKEVGR